LANISKILTIVAIVVAAIAVFAVLYSQILIAKDSYNSQIQVSFSKSPPAYDYSCDESDYQIHFAIKNIGAKDVVGLSISISNPLCVGGVPPLPQTLNASSSTGSLLSFYAQSTNQNGTLTISGNNTFVQANF
jgi:hypothetical protein